MHTIATAGHIDHGKSRLIQALTGIDPDRLKEEQQRGMTIDLGFARLKLPSGREAGIVDVPGHQRFIRNMLAGIGGTDVVLFVVAATEGWMPQSQEHLEIVNLLGISRGIIALTKADLVEEDWLEMVIEEVGEELAGTTLADAEIIPVSSTTGEGLEHLRSQLDALLEKAPAPPDHGRPRLWIDRVFSVRGTGTVVTGTLVGGSLEIDQPVMVLPAGLSSRVRGLETHGMAVTHLPSGSRAALNLAGIEVGAVSRGDAVTGRNQLVPSDTINVMLHSLPALSYSIRTLSELKFYVGSAELLTQVRLLDREELMPNEACLAQMRLERKAAVEFHDRFIVRDATRQDTVGGGIILDPLAYRVRGRDLRLPRTAPGAYKVLSKTRFPVRRLDLELLAARVQATASDLVSIILQERGWVAWEELGKEVPLVPERLTQLLRELEARREVVALPSWVVAPATWRLLTENLTQEISAYHARYPLRAGLAREVLRSSMGMETKLFDEVIARLVEEGKLVASGAFVRLTGFRPTFDEQQAQEAARILEVVRAARFSPPDLERLLGELAGEKEVVGALLEQGRLVNIGKGLIYLDDTLAEVKTYVAEAVAATGAIDVGTLRDVLGTTRKYAVALLEYMDQVGFTRRIGDQRVLA